MNRQKKHKMKKEKPETSTSLSRAQQEHDLAYYIHDRVELMHQVFTVLKSKEIKAMAPECVRNISSDDLQELCTEELLGISSKRLCAILDGGEPPSDTESSSPSPSPEMETISLDSISSDDDVLSETSSKKKKHKHRRRSKGKRKSRGEASGERGEKGAAGGGRGGLTVLELLELQARARAIRAQLHCEQALKRASEPLVEDHASSDNEVVIKEEPPEVVEISSDDEKPNIQLLEAAAQESNVPEIQEAAQTPTVTKRISDLIITVPQTKPTRRIKLNRGKPTVQVPSAASTNSNDTDKVAEQVTDKPKKKKKDKKRRKDKEGSDHDEITLQLSDSEKMDLLEDFDRQHYDTVTSSEDSESSSDSDDKDKKRKDNVSKSKKGKDAKIVTDKVLENAVANIVSEEAKSKESDKILQGTAKEEERRSSDDAATAIGEELKKGGEASVEVALGMDTQNNSENALSLDTVLEIASISNIPLENTDSQVVNNGESNLTSENNEEVVKEAGEENKEEPTKADSVNDKSEGELTDRESSEVEAIDVQEAVSVPDEKMKKRKKSKKKIKETEQNTDDVLELSDDSSCYEVAGTILSKEPTAEQIAALSAKIDEIGQVTDDNDSCQAENVSWKDRYLESTKVKRVMTTSNILNALRKKNKDLKRRIEETRLVETQKEVVAEVAEPVKVSLEEGTIEHYNTLEASTKYVDPVGDEKTRDRDKNVTKEMKKDAKQLLKMYKKLLKYNDMNKQKDPNKKKKKKAKKSKTRDKEDGGGVAATENT